MAAPMTMATGLLLMVLCTYCIVLAGSMIIPSSCCLAFISKRIPERRVINYQLSNRSVCPKAGVIFTTRKGQRFCGNPKLLWVQRYMKNLDAKQKKASSRTRVMGAKVAVKRHPANSTSI
ncbi:C-C motif chemokine 24 [Globicephala melas]|uniref:C-C motif chemokine 24 n=1 Tax=Globicephala melas TaxID=9731 RepID=UPI00122EB4AB|nr:C-C motif chemokine 24 [Globicephala melas]